MNYVKAILIIALVLGGFPLGSFAQSCGNLVINPVTGLWDCAGNAGSASGTVTSIMGSNGVGTSTGSAITTTGTFWADWPRNAQTGTTYALVTGDRGKVVTFSNAASIAVSINQAGTTGFEAGWLTIVKNIGDGTVTITPTTSTIDGALTLVLYTGDWALISSAGGQYETINSKLLQSTGVVVTPARTGKTVLADTTYLLSKGVDQSGAPKYCASADSAGTSYTCALTPTLDVANLVAGATFIWTRTNGCTTGTALQLQIDSTGAKNVLAADGSTVLTTTECGAGRVLLLEYNGTHFRMLAGGVSSGGSSGPLITQGTYASLPATCTTNDVYYYTNAVFTHARCSAANTWSNFYHGKLVMLPPAVASGWTTQTTNNGGGTYTFTDTQGSVRLTSTTGTASKYIRSLPATPDFTVSVCALTSIGETNSSFYIGLSDGTSNTAWQQTMYADHGSGNVTLRWQNWKFWAYDAGAATLADFQNPEHICYQVKQLSGTRTYSTSLDGTNWFERYSTTSTTFITPTHYWIAIKGAGDAIVYHIDAQ